VAGQFLKLILSRPVLDANTQPAYYALAPLSDHLRIIKQLELACSMAPC